LFGLSAAAAGVAEVWLLARSLRTGRNSLSWLGRLLMVVVVLLLAATSGHLLSGALGWALGFGVAVAVTSRRYR